MIDSNYYETPVCLMDLVVEAQEWSYRDSEKFELFKKYLQKVERNSMRS